MNWEQFTTRLIPSIIVMIVIVIIAGVVIGLYYRWRNKKVRK